MRVLITSIPQVSHVFPIVPMGQALQAAGHEVLVVAQPNVAPALAPTGLPVKTVGAAFDMLAFYQVTLPSGTLPVEAWGFDLDRMNALAARPWSHWAREIFGPQLEAASRWRPDLIICDPMEIAALATGGVLNVPVVEHRWGPGSTTQSFRTEAAKRMAPLVRKHGLAGLPAAAFVLDPCPPSIQSPGTEPGHPIRYVPYNGPGTLPEGALARDRPRVCVSFGRVAASATEGAALRWTLEALDQISGIDVTLALTPKDARELGPVPSNVEVLLDVPLNLITGRCDVLVHHGGNGTGMTGLCDGVPQVTMPQLPDQAQFGQLLHDYGAGRNLGDGDSQRSIEAIRTAISAALEEPGYRAAAKRVQAEIDAMPEPAAVVRELEELASTVLAEP